MVENEGGRTNYIAIVGFLLCFCVIMVSSQKMSSDQQTTFDLNPHSIFDQITKIFVEAENWAIPYLPLHVAFLDLILALDTCAAYR